MGDAAEHVTCQEVVELVNDYLESALPPLEAEVFEQHLNLCDGCVTYVRQMRATMTTVGRLGEDDIPDETRDRLLAVFRGWRRTQ